MRAGGGASSRLLAKGDAKKALVFCPLEWDGEEGGGEWGWTSDNVEDIDDDEVNTLM